MLMNAWLIGVGAFRQGSLPFSDGPADRFSQARIGLEEVFHGSVADLEYLGLFQGDDVGGAGFTRKEGHLAKEVSFGELRDCARAVAVSDLDGDAAAVDYEH